VEAELLFVAVVVLVRNQIEGGYDNSQFTGLFHSIPVLVAYAVVDNIELALGQNVGNRIHVGVWLVSRKERSSIVDLGDEAVCRVAISADACHQYLAILVLGATLPGNKV